MTTKVNYWYNPPFSNWNAECPEGHSRCFACGVVSMFPEPDPCVTCGRKDEKVCNQCGYIESSKDEHE